MIVTSLPIHLYFVKILSDIQVHIMFKCHQRSLNVAGWRTLLIICFSLSNGLADSLKSTFTAVHLVRNS